MTENEQRLVELFNGLVPISGKASSKAGEIVRAINRIAYRFYNDGDRIGIGYGKETCNPPARFLQQNTEPGIALAVKMLWEAPNDKLYQYVLDVTIGMIIDFIIQHPELRQMETEDMWNYRDEHEDVDSYEDEEDES